MTKLKLRWEIGTKPTGLSRVCTKRAWPTAYYSGTEIAAASICCEDSYDLNRANSNEHAELTVRITDYRPAGQAWVWRTLKQRATTLAQAKELVLSFLSAHPEFLPQELKPKENKNA